MKQRREGKMVFIENIRGKKKKLYIFTNNFNIVLG